MISREIKNQNSINLFFNTYFNIILVVIVILVLAFSYFLVLKPKYDSTMMAISLNYEQQQKLYLAQQKKLNNLKTIADLYDKISAADLKKFNGVLPDSYVKERLFGELDEIITTNGFILNSISIDKSEIPAAAEGAPAPSVKTGAINIQLAISAIDYAGFKNLLKLLESNLRLFDISQVSFSPSGNSASLTLTTYYYNK